MARTNHLSSLIALRPRRIGRTGNTQGKLTGINHCDGNDSNSLNHSCRGRNHPEKPNPRSSTSPPPPQFITSAEYSPLGRCLLSATMRSLRHLTTRHNICTLLNSAVELFPNLDNYHRHSTSNASMFSSTLGKPAMGKS